ncbi:MAG: pyridoxal phosphate-dependent aminotransferase [Candidatus Omnitrophica bacterium]|nr:pyridoxal phosphate-dependent aminotransferase [Candidatus Omnitrophota bacterium]
MFSKRTEWSLEKNPLTLLFEDLKNKNHAIFDLTISNPTKCAIDYPQDQILQALCDNKNIFYDPASFGSLAARKTVASNSRQSEFLIDPDQVILTSSTSEAYSFLFRLLLNPDEHILLPRPSYPLFEFLANLNDVEVDFYPFVYDEEWKIDCDALEGLIKGTTKAIVLVNPNNPTGSFVKPAELKKINQICKENNISIICDEVFLDYGFKEDKGALHSLSSNKEVLTFVLGGLSKALGLPQMKLSWILTSGPEDMVKEALNRLEVIADTYLSVSTPSQNALAKWFNLKADIQGKIKDRLAHNKGILNDIFLDKNHLCQILKADGGWYAVIKVLTNVQEESFVYNLLKEKQVFVHPGYFFDFEDEPYLVVSLLTNPEIFEQGLQRIASYLDLTVKP